MAMTTKRRTTGNPPNSNSGMTLIELMVSITLGLLLIAGALQLFLSSRQTYRVRETVARIQENGRVALELVARHARMAGYEPRADIVLLPCSNAVDTSTGNCAVLGTEGGSTNDTLSLRYISDGTMTGCAGTHFDTMNDVVRSAFRISVDEDTGISNLQCADYPGSELGTPGTAGPLVDYVSKLDILYGWQPEANSIQYVNASQLDTGTKWKQVTSIQITIQVDSPDSRSFPCSDESGTVVPQCTFTTTVALRNRLR